MIKEKIKRLAKEFHLDVVNIRRHLHQYPELSFKEYETSKYIQEKLTEYGIVFQNNIAGTGVVGLIEGKNPNCKCIALRADMDALPIQELNDFTYCSKKEGVMHACGHDVHTSSLLGVARILNELKDEWEGSVKLIFQPAEEKFPGGASMMISEGVLENPKVDKIIGQHVSPELSCGFIGMKPGMFMASADEIYITINGVGGHAAIPEKNLNPIPIASKMIANLYDRFDFINDIPSVFSIGMIKGGNIGNIVPSKVNLEGTFRAMDENWRKEAHEIIRSICQSVASHYGASCQVDIKVGYPFLENDKSLTETCFKNAQEYIIPEKVVLIPERMTAEDFAYYTHYVPSCFYRLGVGFKGEDEKLLHNPYFDIDEAALEVSVGLMAYLAIHA